MGLERTFEVGETNNTARALGEPIEFTNFSSIGGTSVYQEQKEISV